jgi:putative transcriptional regulator
MQALASDVIIMSVSSLAPALLVSMPQLVDPNFKRTVVLLCKHGEEGAFGLVVNRPVTSGRVILDRDALIAAESSHPDAGSEAAGSRLAPAAMQGRELQIWMGGPVEPERSWILLATVSTGAGWEPAAVSTGAGCEPAAVSESAGPPSLLEPGEGVGGERITEGLYLSTSLAVLRRLFEADPPPRARLIAGYSGWGPGQLEAELQASAWLISDVDADLIFETAPGAMWEAAIRRMGADPAALQISRGVH